MGFSPGAARLLLQETLGELALSISRAIGLMSDSLGQGLFCSLPILDRGGRK